MPGWLTRGRIIALAIPAAVVALVAAAFVTPAPHEIHAADAMPVNAQLVYSSPFVVGYPVVQPSQSLDTIRCEIWRTRGQYRPASACDSSALAHAFFPNLTQNPTTLYVPWTPCSNFNVEFRSPSRTLVIHCYSAEPWIWTAPRMMGVEAQPRLALLLIPTQSIPPGNIAIVQDNRIERFLHDDSYEFPLGIATIA
jgi:hypothetical protein